MLRTHVYTQGPDPWQRGGRFSLTREYFRADFGPRGSPFPGQVSISVSPKITRQESPGIHLKGDRHKYRHIRKTAGIPERMMPWKNSLKLMFIRKIYDMIDKEKRFVSLSLSFRTIRGTDHTTAMDIERRTKHEICVC